MSAWFVQANSQGLDLFASPLSTFPISIGAWIYPLVVSGGGVQCFLSVTSSANNNYATVYIDNAAAWTLEKTGGGVVTVSNAVAGEWHYVLMRVISATSVRLSVLNGRTQLIAHANNTTVGTMTGFDRINVGDFMFGGASPNNFFGGGIGELFVSNNDCYSGGGQQADNSFIRKLAYYGPLSIPRIMDQLVDYRSLRSSAAYGHGDEVLPGYLGLRNWTNTNGITNGPHPPLPPDYVKIKPPRSVLIV